MNQDDKLPDRERPFPLAIIDVLNQKNDTPEFNKELGIIAKVDLDIHPTLLHHMDHGKSHPILVLHTGSDGTGLDHARLIEHTKKNNQKIGVIGHVVFPSMQGKSILVNDGFHDKLINDFKKEINLLNDHLPISDECNNRSARRKKNKFKNKKR